MDPAKPPELQPLICQRAHGHVVYVAVGSGAHVQPVRFNQSRTHRPTGRRQACSALSPTACPNAECAANSVQVISRACKQLPAGAGAARLQRLRRAGALQRGAQVRLGRQLERRAQPAAQRARAHRRRRALPRGRRLPCEQHPERASGTPSGAVCCADQADMTPSMRRPMISQFRLLRGSPADGHTGWALCARRISLRRRKEVPEVRASSQELAARLAHCGHAPRQAWPAKPGSASSHDQLTLPGHPVGTAAHAHQWPDHAVTFIYHHLPCYRAHV